MSRAQANSYQVVAIGVSTGGVTALRRLLIRLPANFAIPLLIVQHISPGAGDGLARLLDEQCAIHVKEADEGENIRPGTVYIAPPNYHLLVSASGEVNFSVDPPVSYARPSVYVLFESVADTFGAAAIGVILTGANHDGSQGLKSIALAGGLTIVQDPADSEASQMPLAALSVTKVDYVVPLEEIAPLLRRFAEEPTVTHDVGDIDGVAYVTS